MTYAEMYELLDKCKVATPASVKLTRDQIDSIPAAERPAYHDGSVGSLFDVPVVLVERVEDSTPYQIGLGLI